MGEKIEKEKSWIKIKPEELKKIIVDLAKKGESPSKIGIVLRDKHAIPTTKIFGKKIEQILKEEKIDYINSKKRVEKKIEKLKSHIKENKHDYTASRSLTKKLWKIYHLNKQKH